MGGELHDCPLCGCREAVSKEEKDKYESIKRENAQLKANLYEIRCVLGEAAVREILVSQVGRLLFKINKVRELAEIGGGQ
jgi:hypothetical protein